MTSITWGRFAAGGIVANRICAFMRARPGPGPKTVVAAGLATWFLLSVSASIQYVPLGLYSKET